MSVIFSKRSLKILIGFYRLSVKTDSNHLAEYVIKIQNYIFYYIFYTIFRLEAIILYFYNKNYNYTNNKPDNFLR